MLRRILMVLAVVVALVPYLGIPRAIDAYIFSTLGMSMLLLLLFSKRSKKRPIEPQSAEVVVKPEPKSPHIQNETESSPESARFLEVSHDHAEIHPSIDVSLPRAVDPHPQVEAADIVHAPKRHRTRKARTEESVEIA